MSTENQKKGLGGRLIGINIPSGDPAKSKAFYEELLGEEMGRSLNKSWVSFHAWISAGVKLTVNQSAAPTDQTMPNYLVDDLAQASTEIQRLGGQFLHGPIDLPVEPAALDDFKDSYQNLGFGVRTDVEPTLGKSSIFKDPSGNRFVLTELRPYARVFHENGRVSRHEAMQHRAGMNAGKKI